MRYVLVVSLLLLTFCASAFGADYFRIDVDTLYEGQTSDWEFYIKRECPEPEFIYGISNAWEMNAVGNATWEYVGFAPSPESFDMWNLGGLLLTHDFAGPGTTSSRFMVGGAAMTPAGMPIIDEEELHFTISFTMGDLPTGSTGDGILIDSTSFIFAP